MKMAAIIEKVAEISKAAAGGDHEAAHAMEDDLYRNFVGYVLRARNTEMLKLLAKEVLKTKDIPISRHAA